MKIIEKKRDLQAILAKIRDQHQKIGLIPTMGSIHEGHLSLVKKSNNLNFYSLVTIFINPTQFNDKSDFIKYPKNRKVDIQKLKKIECDAIYFPKTEHIYPDELKSIKKVYEYRNIMCDKFRPGHFDGVTTVVDILFNIIKPDHAFFGEKDFQQLKIIEKLNEISKHQIIIEPCSSVRAANGMSFSSRYTNFTLVQKNIFDKIANEIMNCVNILKKKIDYSVIKKLKKDLLDLTIVKIDYIEIRDEKSLELTNIKNNARLFVAFYIDRIRIVDNFILY